MVTGSIPVAATKPLISASHTPATEALFKPSLKARTYAEIALFNWLIRKKLLLNSQLIKIKVLIAGRKAVKLPRERH